ncbi:MAG: UvrD-helicase domain-containing protein [Alicyclobacillus macrosporangiidus]|nr:UvrD-helicase domain-containing protein [Alicyclobacillus macrosporangiidus]
MDTREPCVEIRSGSRSHRVSYDTLMSGGAQVQRMLHEYYELGADLRCLCNPERPVPMHLRRVRIRPPSYVVVTNPYSEHHPDCPRFHIVPPRPGERKRPSDAFRDEYKVPLPTSTENASQRQIGAIESRSTKRGMFVPSLDQLNEAQREAATHVDGPCIVIAAAGSGKTAMLIARIKYLIDSGVNPERIVACTFTKKAAGEMKGRLVEAVGPKGKPVTIGTIHSVAYRMVLPQLGDEWKVVPEPYWLIEQVLEEPNEYNRHGVGPVMNPSEAVLAVFKAKADALLPGQVPEPLGKVYAAYEALKVERKQLDFEDLLMHAIRLFRSDTKFAMHWRNRWDYVLVDEFQDTNTAQWLFLLELVERTKNLFVVGDDWQSIYGFRGARPGLIAEFMRQFPQAKKVFLTVNYRSHDLIVELGNRVIQLNRGHQVQKRVVANREMPDHAVTQVITVETDVEEARFVAEEIERMRKRHPDVPWHEYAVLYRTNIQSRVYEEALAERGIPYHVVGDTHFYEHRDVQVILDYLRTTQDTSDPSVWGHLLNRPKRFIPISVAREVQQAGWEAVVQHEKCRSFVHTIESLKKIPNPGKAIQWLVQTQKGLIRQQDEDEPIKWVDALIASASRYRTIPEFLRFVDWIIEKSKEPKDDAVQLMTIHKSKGLEWTTVFVAGLAEGLLPHKKSRAGESLREETRLCYVAITRAKENLYLLAAKQYGDKERQLSRFVKALQA